MLSFNLSDAKQCLNRGEYESAVRMLRELSMSGDGEACLMLGDMYHEGMGVEKSASRAVQYYILSNNAGCIEGKRRLSNALRTGDGVISSRRTAFKVLESALKGDHHEAMSA